MKIARLVFLQVAFLSFLLFAAPDSLTANKPDSSAPGAAKAAAVKAPVLAPAPLPKTDNISKKNTLEEEDLLIEEADVKKNAVRDAAIKDSLAKFQAANPVHVDSAQAAALKTKALTDSTHGPAAGTNSEAVSAPKDTSNLAAPVHVEKPKVATPTIESVHSINFAKNLKDYRSPKVAMFLSLLVPGLGQAYTKHYIRAGIFVALEATAIGLSVAYNAKGKNEYNSAKSFADQNYSINNFSAYYGLLGNYLAGSTQLGTDSAAREELNGIFFDSLPAIQASAASKSPAFYSSLEGRSNIYVQGWNDCEPKYSGTNPVGGSNNSGPSNIGGGKLFTYVTHPDTTTSGVLYYLVDRQDASGNVVEQGIFGYSPNQIAYSNMMSKSNDYYKFANTILALMIINHVVSAVDALIGAYAYNSELLGKETFWQHVKLDPQCSADIVNPSFGLALRVGF
jgi:hypothetical protein